jgi:hypothetical protein
MRANDYVVLNHAVETAVARCARRLSKAGFDTGAAVLSDEAVQETITETIVTEICEWFRFDNPD